MDDETRVAIAEINLALTRIGARLNAMQEAILQTLALVGHLGKNDMDIRTQLQALEVYIGVPQE